MQPPNIIFIITDQQRYDTIRALGYDYMETPHLDRLVRKDVSFTGCHVTAASCAPSRPQGSTAPPRLLLSHSPAQLSGPSANLQFSIRNGPPPATPLSPARNRSR